MVNILVVEDSKIVSDSLKNLIENELGYSCVVAESKKEAAKYLLKYKGKFDVALLDLGLPDAPKGEVVDLIRKFSIPTIILTGSNLQADEEKFRNKEIVDYVIKDGSYSIKYAISVVKRIVNNKSVKVLVVDDSRSTCDKVCNLLSRYQVQAIPVYSAESALHILDKNPGIKIIYIDYLMPNMNGLELTREIRKKYSKYDLSIIALSGESNRKIISKFLKYGANDFIYKGFTDEEFFSRLNNSLEILELFENCKNES
ncbi:MAG: response regulator [Campylobacteraceae bacterium]|nr:response regulator [Campylobacteraceae bacterium]